MGKILIKKISYTGDKYFYSSPEFESGVNIIEGENGSGKSTLIKLIYFCLGGNVKEFKKNNRGAHKEITSDKNNFAELDIILNEDRYIFKRLIGENDIIIIDRANSDNIQIVPVKRTKNEKYIFSDWMLEKLNINIVEIFQSNQKFKINLNDILRLIYHDQAPDPSKIYKTPDDDNNNSFADSIEIRKVIFQLLLGKQYNDYYDSNSKLKYLEKETGISKRSLDEYDNITSTFSVIEGDKNIIFLQKMLSDKKTEIKKLLMFRDSLKNERPMSIDSLDEIEQIKNDLLQNELLEGSLKDEKNNKNNDLIKLSYLFDDTVLEATQIKKIIYTDSKLSLFSVDTCPYCLREVTREKGHCICGSEVDENQYERFFYSSTDYIDILKSKQKSVETISSTIEIYKENIKEIDEKINKIAVIRNILKDKLRKTVKHIDGEIDTNRLNELDDKIFDLKEIEKNIERQIIIETKREELQIKYDENVSELDSQRRATKKLELEAESDIKTKIILFNDKYNELMKNTLFDCKSAKIANDNYLPIINNGEYKEASASVSIRFMYYLTLLCLSLNDRVITYPRFLLIDTPETAGIDKEDLINIIEQINNVTDNVNKDDYQIILTTAIDKYPENFRGNKRITITKEKKLLNKVEE